MVYLKLFNGISKFHTLFDTKCVFFKKKLYNQYDIIWKDILTY